MKVVINRCFGGFSLSKEAVQYMANRGSKEAIEMLSQKEFYGYLHETERNDPLLVEAVESLGVNEASGDHAELRVVEIPDGIEWEIDDYDGLESVKERHRSWN